jgi:hypothetical protein
MGHNFMWREKVHVGTPGVGLVDGTMTRTTPQPRPWAWCFTTLYSAARPRSFVDQAKHAAREVAEGRAAGLQGSAAGAGSHPGAHDHDHDDHDDHDHDDHDHADGGNDGYHLAASGGAGSGRRLNRSGGGARSAGGRGRGAGLRLRMVETVLFANGRPTKWLGTSDADGCVVRRSLANTYTARATALKRQTGGKPGRVFEDLVRLTKPHRLLGPHTQ